MEKEGQFAKLVRDQSSSPETLQEQEMAIEEGAK